MSVRNLLERRAAIVAEMRGITNNPAGDDGDLTPEQAQRFDALKAEHDALEQRIARVSFLEDAERRMQGQPLAGTGDRHLDRELQQVGVLDVIRAALGGTDRNAGLARELSNELERRSGRRAQGLFWRPPPAPEVRVLTSASGGTSLVPTEHRPDLYIAALTASSVVRSLGARVISGLTGNLSIPRETDSPAVGWVAENAALSADDADFDAVTLSPKHVGALTEVSRNMILQASPDVEALMQQMLGRNVSQAIDRAAIKGGGSNEPDGVLETSGIQTVTSPASIFEGIAEAVAKADAENVGGSRAILTTPEIRKTAALALDAMGRPIGVGTVFHGIPTTFSNQVPKNLGGGAEHGLIYGDWSELLIGVWSELDILVNPYESTAYSKGNVVIRAMATVDVAVRHPKAFVSVEDVTTSTPAMPAEDQGSA